MRTWRSANAGTNTAGAGPGCFPNHSQGLEILNPRQETGGARLHGAIHAGASDVADAMQAERKRRDSRGIRNQP